MESMYERFEQLMNAKGVRFSDIARETGVNYSTFTDWRAGRYTPKQEKLKKIADYFDVPLDYLINGITVRDQLAKNLASYRKKAGYTQKSAADALGAKPTTVASWEQAKSQPSADMLVSIAICYGVSLSDLCGTDYGQEFTAQEKELIYAFRSADNLEKEMILRLLKYNDAIQNVREKKDNPIPKEA